jgi:hypothetical protein
MKKDELKYVFSYTHRLADGFLEAAVFADTQHKSLSHVKKLEDKLFAAVPFEFKLVGDPQTYFLTKTTKQKFNLGMTIVGGGKNMGDSTDELKKKLFGDIPFPPAIEIEIRVEQILMLKIELVPEISMSRAISALRKKGFLNRRY